MQAPLDAGGEERITAETIVRARIRPGAQYKDLVQLVEQGDALPLDMRREVRMIERLTEPARKWLQSVERAFLHTRTKQGPQQPLSARRTSSAGTSSSKKGRKSRGRGSDGAGRSAQRAQQAASPVGVSLLNDKRTDTLVRQHPLGVSSQQLQELRRVLAHGLAVPGMKQVRAVRRKNAAVEDDPDAVFCLCRDDSGGSMVQCGCCLDWYHNKCVGLKASEAPVRFVCPRCCYGRRPAPETLLTLAQTGREVGISTPELNDVLRLKDKYLTWVKKVACLWRQLPATQAAAAAGGAAGGGQAEAEKQQLRERALRLAVIGDLMEVDTGAQGGAAFVTSEREVGRSTCGVKTTMLCTFGFAHFRICFCFSFCVQVRLCRRSAFVQALSPMMMMMRRRRRRRRRGEKARRKAAVCRLPSERNKELLLLSPLQRAMATTPAKSNKRWMELMLMTMLMR